MKTVRTGDVAVAAKGSKPSKAENRCWSGGAFPSLPTGKVEDTYIRTGHEFITEAALEKRKAHVFPKDSVLVAMIGQEKTRDSAAIMGIEASVSQNSVTWQQSRSAELRVDCKFSGAMSTKEKAEKNRFRDKGSAGRLKQVSKIIQLARRDSTLS